MTSVMREIYSPGDLVHVIFCPEPCIVVEAVNRATVQKMPGSNVLYKVISPKGVGYAFEHEITGPAVAHT